MRVLTVARTRMAGDRVCVGGIDVDSGRSVRLLGSDHRNLDESHPIRPGEIWDIQYTNADRVRPPHVEDIIVSRGHREGVVDDLRAAILDLAEPWTGTPDGLLEFTSAGTAYVSPSGSLPQSSTGFWRADRNLVLSQFDEHGRRYWLPDGERLRSVKYVGMEPPIDHVAAGMIVRFSLSRWAEFPPGVGEQRCYLQLSGWYT